MSAVINTEEIAEKIHFQILDEELEKLVKDHVDKALKEAGFIKEEAEASSNKSCNKSAAAIGGVIAAVVVMFGVFSAV